MGNVAVRQVLERALALIRLGWTQGLFARDDRGRDVSSCHSRAVCWCLMGAVRRAAFDLWPELGAVTWAGLLDDTTRALVSVVPPEQLTAGLSPGDQLIGWNDNRQRTVAEVYGVLVSAIEVQPLC